MEKLNQWIERRPVNERSDCLVADISSQKDFFEKATVFFGQGALKLGDPLADHPSAPSFARLASTTSVRNFRLHDVVLDADSLLLFKNGQAVRETSYFVPDDLCRGTQVHDDTLIRLEGGTDFIMGFNRMHSAYHHWVTQCLPSIDWSIRTHRGSAPRVILPELAPWQDEMLTILGHGAIPRLVPKSGRQYLLPVVEYSQFLYGVTSFGISLSALQTARDLRQRVGRRHSPYDVIYAACSSPYYGSLENEAEVIGLLQRRGVHVVDPRSLDLEARVALFSHADVVIGPHSESLADILFCAPGTLVWEWMPDHFQSAFYNRLAQAADLDWWGDLFVRHNPSARAWQVDLDVVAERLRAISQRFATRRRTSQTQTGPKLSPVMSGASRALDELMMQFESLGDNCEFGLVQREAGTEPLGLLRFAGFYLPIEVRLEKLVAALETGFESLGRIEAVAVELAGETGRREFLVKETAYHLLYHTFILEGQAEAEELRQREARRLTFLRRKLSEDLAAGEKIWVWKSKATATQDQIAPLLNVLRRLGPNTLLWVVEGDTGHPPGTVERLEDDLIKGYVERFAPYEAATQIRPASWFQVCQRAFDLFRGIEQPEEVAEVATPLAAPLTGMDYLRSAASLPPVPPPPPVGIWARVMGWLRRMRGRRS